jgi:hypothetical protein
MRRSIPLTLASLLLAVAAPEAHAQISVTAYSACAPPDSAYVIWTTYDPSADPYAVPEFVGYDVMRRVIPGCEEYVRANEEIIPRVFGTTTHYFQELSVAPGAVVKYQIRAVDADRQQVFIPGFCFSLSCETHLVCPPLSAPITIGRLEQIGSFVYVIPCPGTCYPSPYLDPETAAGLAPYVGTSATFRFFGNVVCGGIEGCGIGVDSWEPATCVTTTKPVSWGRLKTIYR